MLHYPNIDPVAFRVGSWPIYWYGIMYLLGFMGAFLLGEWRARQPNSGWTSEQVSDLIFYAALGVIIGGRLGYILFYDFFFFIKHPLNMFHLWDGGMSFHGGLLGVIISLWLMSKKFDKHLFAITDFAAPLTPIGLACGRLGNFINGELWGRTTDVSWGMVFPTGGPLPRHPSQLYEFMLEGVMLFIILWWYSSKPRAMGATSGLFLLCYSVFRFSLEFFRQPDAQLGFIAFGWLTMGQLLSVPMLILGGYLMLRARHDRGE